MIEFEGYATRFGVVHEPGRQVELTGNRYNESAVKVVMVPGCFAAAIERLRSGRRVRMLWDHDPRKEVGEWVDIREDEDGLRVRGRLAADIRPYRLGFVAGRFPGMSIGGGLWLRPGDVDIILTPQGEVRVLRHNAMLEEISILPLGGCPGAVVTHWQEEPVRALA